MFIIAVGTLVTVVGLLWRKTEKQHESTIEDLRELKEEKKITDERVLELTGRVGRIEGIEKGIEMLASELIQQVRKENE